MSVLSVPAPAFAMGLPWGEREEALVQQMRCLQKRVPGSLLGISAPFQQLEVGSFSFPTEAKQQSLETLLT